MALCEFANFQVFVAASLAADATQEIVNFRQISRFLRDFPKLVCCLVSLGSTQGRSQYRATPTLSTRDVQNKCVLLQVFAVVRKGQMTPCGMDFLIKRILPVNSSSLVTLGKKGGQIMACSAVQTVQYSTMQCCAVQCSAYGAVQCHALHCSAKWHTLV